MPQRSNEFQDLVTLIERALAPRGAKVTESALVPGVDAEDKREIDILIESAVGPYIMKVAVEAKDEGRKMDIVKFESIIAKYSSRSGILVNKVVVVSRSGFTKPTFKRAKREGIELLTLSDALVADWAQKTPQILRFSISPHLDRFELQPSPPEPESTQRLVHAGHLVCRCCGRSRGTPYQIASNFLFDQDLLHDMRVYASRNGGSACRIVRWDVPNNLVLRDGDKDYHVDSMTAHIHCTEARTTLAVKAYQHGDDIVHHLSGNAAGKKIQILLPDGHQSEKIIMKLSDGDVPTASLSQHDTAQIADTLPLPSQAGALLDQLRTSFDGLDVTIETQTNVHNFLTGVDVPLDALVKVYMSGPGRVRCGIVWSRDDSPTTAAQVREWEAIAAGAELDRVLLLNDFGLDDNARQIAENSIVKVLRTPEVKFQHAVAPVFLWITGLRLFHASLFCCGNKLPKDSTFSHVEVGPRQLTPAQFYESVESQIVTSSIDAFVDRASLRSIFGDCEFRFDVRTHSDVKFFIPSGDSRRLTRLQGTATRCVPSPGGSTRFP